MMPSASENTARVAVVVPVYREKLSSDEQLSLKHLENYLDSYPRIAIAPEDLTFCRSGFEVRYFPAEYFTSVDAYSQLLLSPGFYDCFSDVDFILIYQLDCLVFSDQLQEWCDAGFDYLGAPWFRLKNDASSDCSRVGNGGLSLRRVDAFLNVLHSKRYVEEATSIWQELSSVTLADIDHLPPIQRFLKKLQVLRSVRRGVKWYTAHYTLNEDHFWSDRARLFYPDFTVAPVDVALQFAFEAHPRYCFEQNNFQLPFGCHAWSKWDRAFWEPFLLDRSASARR